MAERTEISWADATFNCWIGCTEVSVAAAHGGGCDNCYARDLAGRHGWAKWGAGQPRHRTSADTWNKPRVWNRKAEKTGYRPRVFCASLADVFDNEVPDEWRLDLWRLISQTPNLRWMLLTKRVSNIAKMLPPMFQRFPEEYAHVGFMITAVNQLEWDRDVPRLLRLKATQGFAWVGVSAEPLLGPIVMGDVRPDWLIVGGESGAAARPMHQSWARSLRDQCAAANVAFHFKQWGGLRPKSNGCELDGVEHKAFPAALAA